MCLCIHWHNDALVCEDWEEENRVLAGVAERVRCYCGQVICLLYGLSSSFIHWC